MEGTESQESAYWHAAVNIVTGFFYAECPDCGKNLSRHGILPGMSGRPSFVCLDKGENHMIEREHINIERAAATEQGLDPMTTHLAEIGVPASVVQTGGMCMVIFVYLTENTEGDYIGITRAERDEQGNDHDGWLVCLYQAGEDADEPFTLSWNATRDETVELIRQHRWLSSVLDKMS